MRSIVAAIGVAWLGCAPQRDPPADRDSDAAGTCATLGGFTLAATSSCYMFGDNVFSWLDARSFCRAWGGDLVEIGSPAENAALAARVEGSVWIGGRGCSVLRGPDGSSREVPCSGDVPVRALCEAP